jgi:hypothetical protein
MTLTTLVSIAMLALPAFLHAEPVDLQAKGGMFKLCEIKMNTAVKDLRGTLRISEMVQDAKWAPLIGVGIRDADDEPLYRLALAATGRNLSSLTISQDFQSATVDAFEVLGSVDPAAEVPFRLRWGDEGWARAEAGGSGERSLNFMRKPGRLFVIVSGATAHLELHDAASVDCDSDVSKKNRRVSIQDNLVGTWEAIAEAGQKASLRVQADGRVVLTWGDEILGATYDLDTDTQPMRLDLVTLDAAGQEIGRLKGAMSVITPTSFRLTIDAAASSRPDALRPAFPSTGLVFDKMIGRPTPG